MEQKQDVYLISMLAFRMVIQGSGSGLCKWRVESLSGGPINGC